MASKAMVFGLVAFGGLALLVASSKSKAAAAEAPTPSAGPPDPVPPQLPPYSQTQDPPAPQTPGTPYYPEPSYDYAADGGGGGGGALPPAMPPAPTPAPATSETPATPIPGLREPTIPSGTIPLSAVTLSDPPASAAPVKRPFGDKPLDVVATQSNFAPPKANVAPPPAAKRNGTQAAKDLLAYVTPILRAKRGAELGAKGNPNAFVKAAQLDMGVLPADGIYGPVTRAKGKSLTGATFPPR